MSTCVGQFFIYKVVMSVFKGYSVPANLKRLHPVALVLYTCIIFETRCIIFETCKYYASSLKEYARSLKSYARSLKNFVSTL
jgi:hypothetical protein